MGSINRVLEENEKRKLGFIIREYRKSKFEEAKNKNITINPYTKENFCDNNHLCHFHTLTKLENDLISNDSLYYNFLEKLDLIYQVSIEEHLNHMNQLDHILMDVLKAIEYIDDELMKKIIKNLERIDFKKDCIAYEYTFLFRLVYKLSLLQPIETSELDYLLSFIDFFDGAYKGLAYHCLVIYYINKRIYNKALTYLDKASIIYKQNNISKGLVGVYFVSIYNYIYEYDKQFEIYDEFEQYYEQTNNYKRVVQIYSSKMDYYFLVNSFENAIEYYNRVHNIFKNHTDFNRFEYYIHYNMGIGCLGMNKYNLAFKYIKLAYEKCNNKLVKLIMINFLLILSIKLKINEKETIKFLEDGQKYFSDSSEYEQMVFKYFKYKYENSSYYRRFALEKLIPYLKTMPRKISLLLMIYEDLYD